MGQKIIPISLRLNKNENWHSKWIVDKKEYPSLLHFNLEIQKYFENIFNYKSLKMVKLNVVKNSKNISIYLYVSQHSKNFYILPYNKILFHLNNYYKNNNIKLFIRNIKIKDLKNLKETIKRIFRFICKNKKVNNDKKKMIYHFSYALYTKNINIISYYIKETLQRKKSHKKFINNINKTLEQFFKMFSNFLGYRLQFKGRLNGSKRKKKLVYQEGKIPLNTLKYDIKYHFNEFKTPSGICSIKFWVFLKKN
jgi:ribosomal protein S3